MQNLMITLLACSVTMSMLAFFYIAITPPLAKRYSEKGRYYAWIIVVIGLIIPFRPQFGNPIVKVDMPNNAATPIIQIGNGTPINVPDGNTMISPISSSISLWHIAAAIWLVGMIAFLAYHAIKHYHFVKIVRRWSESITDKQTLALFQSVKSEMGIAKDIKLYRCLSVCSPLMFGFVEPRILLPMVDFAHDELCLVLKHELVHYRRKDLYYKCLVLLATAIHWFNPLVYLMARAIDVQCELSCDAETVKNTDAEMRQHYGEMIIGVVGYQSKLKTVLSTNFYGGKKGMKNRISSIMDIGKKKAGVAIICAAILITIGTGVIFATNAGSSDMASLRDLNPRVLTEDEKLANEYYNAINRQKTAEALKEYNDFGLTYNADVVDENGRGQLYFNGEPICYFADNLATNGKFEGGAYNSGGGTSGVVTERNAVGELTGLKLLSESELKEYKWYL